MIIDRRFGAVASWCFEDEDHPVERDSRQNLNDLLKLCQSAVTILESHQLLRPFKVIFTGWVGPDPNTRKLIRVDEPDASTFFCKKTGAKEFLIHCEQTLDYLENKRGFLYPIDVYILGTGIVFNSDGHACELPDVTSIGGNTAAHHVVCVNTQSDAWLPHGILAKPQCEVYERNAPRLESALQEIQDRLGFSPYLDDEEYSKYAAIRGFRLENITDIDGEVLKTYNGPI